MSEGRKDSLSSTMKEVVSHFVERRTIVHHVLSTIRLNHWTWLRRVPISSACDCSWLAEVGVKRVCVSSFRFVHFYVPSPCHLSSALLLILRPIRDQVLRHESAKISFVLAAFLYDTARGMFLSIL